MQIQSNLKTFWTDDRIDRLKLKLERRKLAVSQFALFQPVVEDLSNLWREEREQALDYFEAGYRIAAKFKAPLINNVAPWVRELKGPPLICRAIMISSILSLAGPFWLCISPL